jgi:[acyl-carrier-protein] S-malonyltransferase
MDNTPSTHAIVFPGQGSQFVGMADPWTVHPASNGILEAVSEALGTDIVAGCRDENLLATTEFVQPALVACDLAAYAVLEATLGPPVGVAGHSLGEFAALVASGACDLAGILGVVLARGRAMQLAGEERPGTMAALLGVDSETAQVLCEESRGDDVLVVANENSPVQVVISGSVEAVERAQALAATRKIRAVRLNVAGAFHSPLMEPAVGPVAEAFSLVTLRTPRFPIAENVSGALVRDTAELGELLARHVVSPVRWESCVRALAAAGASTFIEAGPGDVLTKLAKRIVPTARALAVGSPEAAAASTGST